MMRSAKFLLGLEFFVNVKTIQIHLFLFAETKMKWINDILHLTLFFQKKEYQRPIEGKPNSYHVYNGFQFFDLQKAYPYSQKDTKAVQFCKIIRKGKEWCAFHDGIYDSILLPIIKCLEFYKKQDGYSNSEWQYYTIFFPIVVLNSDLYSINSHINPDDINKVEYIHFTWDVNYKKIKNNYLIDFVTKKGLTEYIEKNINVFVDEFKKAIMP